MIERWGDFGWLDKAATISFGGGVPGMFLVFLLSYLFGEQHAPWLFGLWFSPTLLWLACFWSHLSRHYFPQVAVGIVAMCLVSGMSHPADMGLIGMMIVVGVVASGAAALASPLAEAAINWGRTERFRY